MEPGPRWNRSPYQDSSNPQSNWQSPRYHHHRGGDRGRGGFGYGNNSQGRFRSPNSSHNFSPRGNYNQPRFIDFNNPYSNSPASSYQNQYYQKPRHQSRHFSPRSFHNSPDSFGQQQQQYRPNRGRLSRDNIESWVMPQMWADPWAELRTSNEMESLPSSESTSINVKCDESDCGEPKNSLSTEIPISNKSYNEDEILLSNNDDSSNDEIEQNNT